ncbi:MAG: dephospho-CoA kinase [archaeon]|jgi:dephospho-CoA kinase|nr:dephospho-CoA kinase [archaeon]
MITLALTGNIASGKSTLLKFFKSNDIATVDADKIVDSLYKEPEVQEKISSLFGTFDRKEIASVAFSSEKMKRELEEILHPLVVSEIKKTFSKLAAKNQGIVVVEIPLLFEAGLSGMFDKIIVVHSTREKQIERLAKQGLSREDAIARIDSQLSSDEKVKKADFVIDNNSDIEAALKQAEKIISELNG